MISRSAQNIAWLVHRLVSNPRGVRLDSAAIELGVGERTMRKYKSFLQNDYQPFQSKDGRSMLEEVGEPPFRYLRLVNLRTTTAHGQDGVELAARTAFVHLALQMFSFVQNTPVGSAVQDLIDDFSLRLDDPNFSRGMVRNFSRVIYHVPDAPKSYDEHALVIQDLLRALLFGRRIRVNYRSARSSAVRVLLLEPLTLVTHRSALYLFARTAGTKEVRTYAVDRVQQLTIESEGAITYPPPSEYTPQKHVEGSFGIFRAPNPRRTLVHLRFVDLPWLKAWLRERQWHRTQQFTELPDGRLEMRFFVSAMDEVWPWIRSFGADCEVLAPKGPVPTSYSAQRAFFGDPD